MNAEAIQGSVGEGGRNLSPDVLTVQRLLRTRAFDPGPADGICGAQTTAAIRAFQATFTAHPDGLVEPGRTTWQKLSAGSTAGAKASGQWSGDSSQWSQAKKLASLTPLLRPRVQALTEALAKRAFRPKIVYGWRSETVQLKLCQQGHSKVKFSFHNAQLPDGTPNAYAADIVDERYSWSAQAASSGYWKALGEEAKKLGLYWGGDWVTFRDWAHVQLVPNSQLKKVKKESGL